MKTLEFYDKTYPAKFEVCSRCGGEGTHTNPSIDGNGLTYQDIDDIMYGDGDENFLDDYFGGVYDVICYQCDGKRVDLVVDWDAMTDDQKSDYKSSCDEARSDRLEREAERRAGC